MSVGSSCGSREGRGLQPLPLKMEGQPQNGRLPLSMGRPLSPPLNLPLVAASPRLMPLPQSLPEKEKTFSFWWGLSPQYS